MSQAAAPPPAEGREDLAEAVAAAQEDLHEAVRRAELGRDPFRFVLGALSMTLGLFPQLVARMERAAEAARVPMTPEDKTAFRREVREGLRQEVGKLARATSRRTAALVGAAIAGAALAGGAGGFILGRATTRVDVASLSGALSMDAGAVRTWLDLMRANSDPRPALAVGTSWKDPATQRRAVEFRLWTDPPPATAPQRR